MFTKTVCFIAVTIVCLIWLDDKFDGTELLKIRRIGIYEKKS